MKFLTQVLLLSVMCILNVIFFENLADAATPNFSVSVVIPENQADPNKKFFDLDVFPGQEQNLILQFVNYGSESIALNVSVNPAVTNNNGMIDYSFSKPKSDPSQKNDFSMLIQGEEKVTLSPYEERQVGYQLKVPEKSFAGVLLGGFYITSEAEHSELSGKDKTQANGFQLNNKFAYALAVQLKESSELLNPQLNLRGVKAGLDNYRTALLVNLQNKQPAFVGKLKLLGQIYRQGETRPLRKFSETDLEMAPNSNFNWAIDWQNQSFEPGQYVLKLKAEAKQGNWAFTKNFEITAQESRSLNKRTSKLENEHDKKSFLFLIGCGLLVLSVFFWEIKRAR